MNKMEKLSDAKTDLFKYNVVFKSSVSSVRYCTNDHEQFDWTRFIMIPYYGMDYNSEEDVMWTVSSVFDPCRFDEICKFKALAGTTRFIKYRGDELQVYDINNNIQIQMYVKYGTVMVVFNKNEKCITLLYKEIIPLVKFEAARLIREIMTREFEKAGYYVFHASAVEYKGKGILICGKKESGKTTSMLGCLEYMDDVKYIANDRVYIGYNNALSVIGWPIAAAVRFGSCYNSAIMRNWLNKNTLELSDVNEYRNARMNEKGSSERWKIKKYIELTPFEISKIYNINIASEARIDMVIFPQLRQNLDKVQVEKINADCMANILKKESHSPNDTSYPDRFYLVSNKEEVEENVSLLTLKASELISGYQITYSDFKDIIKFIRDELEN